MCDTLGRIVEKGEFALFGKNSDRQLTEPQVMVYVPEKKHTNKTVNATYIEIGQVEKTHAILISKPSWCYGAEMGVNDCGVCIGNEAVDTIGEYGDNALIGMDLVRLALERSSTAKEAVEVIINLLEKCGQGGNCGYKTPYYYDNSYLIMDLNDLYILETKDKKWAYKKYDYKNISNSLILTNADKFSNKSNFKNAYKKKKFKFLNSAVIRRFLIGRNLSNIYKVNDIFKTLRKHFALNPYSNKSPCMHGERYKTTASMVVILKKDKSPVVWFTGTSYPCLSIYKPFVFGAEVEYPILTEQNIEDYSYWQAFENVMSKCSNHKTHKSFYKERDKIEKEIIQKFETDKNSNEVLKYALEREREFFDKWNNILNKKG